VGSGFSRIYSRTYVALAAGRAGDETSEPGRIVILRGDGTGAFQDAAGSVVVPPSPQSMTLADVNGDRRLDLLVTHSHAPSVSVLLNDGGGAFEPAQGSPFGIDDESFGVVAADANGDGKPDLLAGTAATVTVLLGRGAELRGERRDGIAGAITRVARVLHSNAM
jgi:hypothetical protein